MKSTFISWLPHCRNSEALAMALGGKSHLIHWLGFKRPWQAPFKYPLQALETLIRLYKDKPDLVLVASPPVVAALPAYIYARIKNIPFVIDAHTGVFDDPRWTWLLPLSRWLSRAASATIVTNEFLERIVISWKAQAIILDSVPMAFPNTQCGVSRDHYNITFINTFSRDEPVEAVIGAAKNFPQIRFYITGDLKRAPADLQEIAPHNVHFTGWLSDEDYADLLRNATAVMVLTTRDHTMQRGAIEAMELEKPLVTSDWPLLRRTFSRGTIYVDNTIDGITSGIETVICECEWLASEMKALRCEKNAAFKITLDKLLAIVKTHSHFSSEPENQEAAQQTSRRNRIGGPL